MPSGVELAQVQPAVILSVDLGKTTCRLRVTQGDTVLDEARGVGAPGLADYAGEESSYSAIMITLDRLKDSSRAAITHCGVGAPGTEADRSAAKGLLKRLNRALRIPIAIINDALAAHVGAFSGGQGVILIAGTGAIAVGLGADGLVKHVDGWGPWLGDDGGGRWIGQQGLQHALRSYDNRGSYTSLRDAAIAMAGDLDTLPRWVSETGEPARRLASFAPTVLDHAMAGDTDAAGIVGKATAYLAAAASAVSVPYGLPVAVTGGLFEHRYFRNHLLISLEDRGLATIEPAGDALSGVATIAVETNLPHERRVTRA